MSDRTTPIWLYVAAAAFVGVIVLVFVASATRTEPPSFIPSPIEPRAVGEAFIVDTVTVDARDGSTWARFDFDVGSVVDESAVGWDLALNRFHVVVNGGRGYTGVGGAIAVAAPFDSVTEAPRDGYTTTEKALDDGAATPALERWYQYSFFAHTLDPKDETYIIRTAEGRYAKARILGYYCPQATPGCLTFEYAYQGDGSRRLTP